MGQESNGRNNKHPIGLEPGEKESGKRTEHSEEIAANMQLIKRLLKQQNCLTRFSYG